ncbi:SPOR domain-containing protein [Wenzhouxiangella sp. EGI_FJ10305]|uniref:SPOR domain-containing protein n=1 Tax=Wenzhouxiangella sp. EGI_FJ10305 TaxID=3243768 RepID=UPI0035D6B098
MNDLNWRWIAVALIVVNAVIFVIGRLGAAPPPERDGELPELDPNLPRAELVDAMGGDEDGSGPTCYTLGPLPTLLAQQRASDRLAPFTSRLQTRQTEADRDRGWWVHLPAADRSEALGLTRALAERGVEDYYVVAGGSLENAVSVGLYENIENARDRQRRIRAMGFNAQLEVRREKVPRFWVDYRVEPGESPPWRFIVRASPNAQRVRVPCTDYRLTDGNGD